MRCEIGEAVRFAFSRFLDRVTIQHSFCSVFPICEKITFLIKM